MAKITRIHADKVPQRIHYLNEWLAYRRMSQADLVREIGVNKSAVSKWCSGALPSEDNLLKVAAVLSIEPNALFRDPEDDWFARLFRERAASVFKDRTDEEIARMMATLETAFPRKDGTNG